MTTKLEKIFVILLIVLLPSQLAFHFWPSWSFIYGVRVDYLSPTLYLTDLLIIALFLTSRLRIRVPLLIIIFSVFNILHSAFPLLVLYKWFRVLEYFWFFKYLINIQHSTFSIQLGLSLSIIWTSLLGWGQFIKQASIGGLWSWLGERAFSVSTPGIAKIQIFNNWLTGQLGTGELLRVYATLPHPNALAGFLLVSGLIVFFLKPKSKKILSLENCALGLAALTIPITFSRTAIVLEILILLLWMHPLILKIILGLIGLFFLFSFTGSAFSLPDRISLNHLAISALRHSPLLGMGLGTFIPSAMNNELITNNFIRQPVHNIYLLFASELGLPALLVIGYLIIKNYLLAKRDEVDIENLKLKIPVLVILITGLADHYWLTLHQNTLLLVVLLAIIKVQFMTTNDNL